jgi:hypothetical protein
MDFGAEVIKDIGIDEFPQLREVGTLLVPEVVFADLGYII